MKTEKRLTMALSVLVALMMLAVPLASSSNLFVDGGQTNSNGDAPSLGANEAVGTYILYFDFNVPENSLDAAKLKDTFKGTASAIDNIGTKGDGADAKDGSIEFSYIKGETAQEDRILAYVKQPTGTGDSLELITIGDVISNLNTLVFDGRYGYDLVSWKGADNNSYSEGDDTAVSKNMNYTANWELSSVTAYTESSDNTDNPPETPVVSTNAEPIEATYDFKEFKVNVTINNETKEYIKAYLVTEDADGNPIIKFNVGLSLDKNNLGTTTTFNEIRPGEESIAGTGSEGFLFGGVNAEDSVWSYARVYNVLTTDSNKKVVYDSKETDEKKYAASVSGDSQNSFNVNFELFSTLTKITISSILFDEDIDVYAYNSSLRFLVYSMLLEFLIDPNPISPVPEDYEFPFIEVVVDENDLGYKYVDPATGKMPVEENKYVLTGWNGSIPLDSLNSVTETSLTLDADVNSYKIIFMVNGEFEVVEVPFGTELSASTTKLDTNGVDHWVSPINKDSSQYVSNTFTDFKEFRFSPDEIKAAEAAGKTNDAFILIACFQPANKTAYAVFNAGTNADFGDELVTTIVIPGEINTPISQLPVAPQKEGKNVFIGWLTPDYKLEEGKYTYTKDVSVDSPIAYSSSQEYNKKNDVSSYTAKIVSYKWTMSFSADGKVIGVLYYEQGTSNTIPLNNADLTTNLVAYQYDGKMYDGKDAKVMNNTLVVYSAAGNAFANIVSPLKAGYKFVQWNDADGKKTISEVKTSKNADDYRSYTSSKQSVEKLTGDITVYADFDALPYTIEYVNTLGTGASQTDGVVVDKEITLLGENALLHENYTLIGWSTVPGAGGNEYKLGGTFVLSGADFEKLANDSTGGKVVVKFYAVWQANGSNVPGDNTGGDGDNTALYLIAGMLAIIAILAIVGIVLMKKK